MYSEEEFFKIIKDKTGRDFNEGTYGFIFGTRCPYQPKQGMLSSTKSIGYTVWKKDKEYPENPHSYLETEDTDINLVISFLNGTMEEYSKSKGLFQIKTKQC